LQVATSLHVDFKTLNKLFYVNSVRAKVLTHCIFHQRASSGKLPATQPATIQQIPAIASQHTAISTFSINGPPPANWGQNC